ncbi:IS1182 family transposase [Christiangramia sp.]|uniref:IS1182 family transposase n=1 Tax=Christiangramia sp. TaxID=1931228 RepID=UPI0026113255|nr:IS1182 family transposase [Christiangramia sp.]
MKFIQGTDRRQASLFPVTLDDIIEQDNTVRAIDIFVNSLELAQLGFKADFGENGRPAYSPATLLKLYIYGYMNKVRSSRQLEKECKRNIELMWLLEGLTPDHNTINNFRRDNPKAIKKVFRATVSIARNFGLIGGILIAGDSTKLRAQNSKKNNYNQKKIQRQLEYIDKKLQQYNELLAEEDGDTNRNEIQKEINKHSRRRKNYKQLQEQLKISKEEQISTSDPESRQILIRRNITEVAYNIQSTVDAKHCIPIDYKVTNQGDRKAMGNMLLRAKSILGTSDFTALYDKGYHSGSQFMIANKLGIDTLVAIPAPVSATPAPDPYYVRENFKYNDKTDTYTCPEGNLMKSNGSRYLHSSGEFRYKLYKTPACKACKVMELCTKSKKGRSIQRSEYRAYLEANEKRVLQSKETYKRRQAIVEHPFGTIKRQWGFDHVMTKKTKARASADIGLIFIAYNLKRIMNIMGKKAFGSLDNLFQSIFFIIRDIVRNFLATPMIKTWICHHQMKLITNPILVLSSAKKTWF